MQSLGGSRIAVDKEPGRDVRRVGLRRYWGLRTERAIDTVTVEEPLEIRISYLYKAARRTESAAVTMRTPGDDKELAAGFLFAEGVLRSVGDVADIRMLGSGESNELLVELTDEAGVDTWHLRRATLISSACGLCGKRTLESAAEASSAVPHATSAEFQIRPELIYHLPKLLREAQSGFASSGGLHAASLISPEGELLALFEDVGRHNALDKLIGSRFLAGLTPIQDAIVFMSSRSSFELVQKSNAAGVSVLITIGAPSSLAIDFALDRGLTLIGFVRDDHFNVYTGEWRLRS